MSSIKRPWLVLFIAMHLALLAQMCSDIYLPSMPAMSVDLSVAIGQVQFASIIAMVCFGCSLFVWGPLSDYYGRKKIALAGISLFILGSLVCTQATDIQILWFGRALQGIGMGCTGAITPAIPKDLFEGADLMRAFAMISMVFGVAPILAQVLGGYLQAHGGWRLNFSVLLIAGMALWAIFARFLPETNKTCKQSPLAYKPLVAEYWAILCDGPFAGYVLCMSLVFAGEIAYNIVTPFIMQQQLGLSPVQNGWLSFFTGGGLLLGALLSGLICRWLDVGQLIKLGLSMLAVSTLCMIMFASANVASVISVVGPMTLYMVGAGLVYPNCIAGIMSRFEGQSGVAGSLMSGLQMAGAGLLNSIVAKWHMASLQPLATLLMGLIAVSVLIYSTLITRAGRDVAPA